jgi:hypothetical protein
MLYIDPYLYLREHQRHVARVTADGLLRAAAGNPRRGPALAGRVARRVRRFGVRPVIQ